MQVTVENQNGDGGKQAGDQVHKPVGKPAADDAMLTEPEEDVANKSFMAELVRGKKQLEMVSKTLLLLLLLLLPLLIRAALLSGVFVSMSSLRKNIFSHPIQWTAASVERQDMSGKIQAVQCAIESLHIQCLHAAFEEEFHLSCASFDSMTFQLPQIDRGPKAMRA
jgi:hypothetical protein